MRLYTAGVLLIGLAACVEGPNQVWMDGQGELFLRYDTVLEADSSGVALNGDIAYVGMDRSVTCAIDIDRAELINEVDLPGDEIVAGSDGMGTIIAWSDVGIHTVQDGALVRTRELSGVVDVFWDGWSERPALLRRTPDGDCTVTGHTRPIEVDGLACDTADVGGTWDGAVYRAGTDLYRMQGDTPQLIRTGVVAHSHGVISALLVDDGNAVELAWGLGDQGRVIDLPGRAVDIAAAGDVVLALLENGDLIEVVDDRVQLIDNIGEVGDILAGAYSNRFAVDRGTEVQFYSLWSNAQFSVAPDRVVD